MNDESFARRMRDLDRPEDPDPAFVDRLYGELAAELGFARPTSTGTRPTRAVPRTRQRRRSWPLMAVAALLLTLGIGALVTSGGLRERTTEDLLARLRETEWMRVAVSREHPQVVVPGATAAGFDVEVAHALAQRLGLRAEPIAYAPGMAGSLVDRAHLVMAASDAHAWQAAGWSLLGSAYHWARHLLVPAGAPIERPADLAGQRVGLAGGLDPGLRLPAGLVVVPVGSDHECLALLEAGDLAACLTTILGPVDIAARPALRILDDPVAVEARGPMVRESSDTARFATEVRDAMASLRAAGALADLSQRFLGSDLTEPPKDS